MLRPLPMTMVLTILALLAATTVRAGDDSREKWWQSPDIARQLQISEDEARQLDNAFDAAQLRMIELRSDVATEKAKLRALLEQPELDEAAIVRQHQSQQEARSRLSAERLSFLLEARKIIGHDRFIRLLEIRDAQRRQRYSEKTENAEKQQ